MWALVMLCAPCWGIRKCLDGIMINVILLNDEDSPWSLKFVEGQILKAIKTDSQINGANGKKNTLKSK